MNPDIYQNYLVYASRNDNSTSWDGNLFKNWDIYLTNLDTNIEYQVTNNNASQIRPAVSGGRVVYMDFRNGNWDIYMTMISYLPEEMSPPPYNNRSPQEALPPQGDQSENPPLIPEFIPFVTVAMLVATTVLITLAVYYKKRKLSKNQNDSLSALFL